MSAVKIGYVTEVSEYQEGLTGAESLTELREHVESWAEVVSDAVAALPNDDGEFARFKHGLALERRGEFAGEPWAERFGAILMPELMFRVSEVALRFGVPWGCAYIRLREEGMLPSVSFQLSEPKENA